MNGLRCAAGLLAGSELTSRVIVHPALWRLPQESQVKAEKLMYRRFGSVDPCLMAATDAAARRFWSGSNLESSQTPRATQALQDGCGGLKAGSDVPPVTLSVGRPVSDSLLQLCVLGSERRDPSRSDPRSFLAGAMVG